MLSDRCITLKCGTVLRLSDLEAARLSYVPCGQIDGEDQPLLKFCTSLGATASRHAAIEDVSLS